MFYCRFCQVNQCKDLGSICIANAGQGTKYLVLEVMAVATETEYYLPGFNGWQDSDLLKHKEQLPHMKSMILNGPGITDVGLRLLAECKNLRELHLVGTYVTNRGLQYISNLKTLDWLVIDGSFITDTGFRSLSGLTNLRSLQLVDTLVSDDGIETLLHFPKLSYLETISERLSDKGLSLIAQQPALSNLRIASQSISDDEFMNLAFCSSLRSLTYDLPLVSRAAHDELNERLPDCFIDPQRYHSSSRFNPLMFHVLRLFVDGKYEQALNCVIDATRYNEMHPIVHGFKAIIYLKLGSYSGYRESLEKLGNLASLYVDFELVNFVRKYKNINELSTLQLIVAKERPEEFLMSTLYKQYRTPEEQQEDSIIIYGRNATGGAVILPAGLQLPPRLAKIPTVSEYIAQQHFFAHKASQMQNHDDYIKQPRPEVKMQAMLKELFSEEGKAKIKNKKDQLPWSW